MRKDLAPLGPEERNVLARMFSGQPGLHFQEAQSGGSELDFANLVAIFWARRWLILSLAVLGVVLGLATALMTTPIYRADVTLEVNPPQVEVIDENSDSNVSPNSWGFIATQADLLTSRSLAETVAQDLSLASEEDFSGSAGSAAEKLKAAANRILDGLKVEEPEQGQLIRFSYESESPQRAAQIANGLADGFIRSGLERRYQASAYARKFLEGQIEKTREDLERTEREQVAYAQAQGIINTSTGESGQPGSDVSSLQGGSLIALNNALADATAKRVQAEGAYRQAQIAGAADATTGTTALRQTAGALEAEYQEKRTLLKPDHPEMLSLRSRIDELSRQIASERSLSAGGRTATLLAEYRGALAAERALQARVNSLKGSVLDLRGRSVRYNILQREVDTNRGLYDALLQRYKEIGVTAGVGASPVSIVDRADVPGSPYKPNYLLHLIGGLGLGLFAGIAAAVGLEYLNDTIDNREDVRNKLNQACLGVVPLKRGKGSFQEDLQDQSSEISEAYAAVLAALRFSTEQGAPKIIQVTSTVASEGKSSSVFALAQSYARRGDRVLIVDSDLRRPAFRASSNSLGLTRLLTNQDPVRNQILSTQFENLWLLPCGPIPPNAADLLATGRLMQILKEADLNFDRIIVDGPPAVGLADAALIASATGHVMMIVEAGVTRTRAAREAVERIQETGAHIVGVTLVKSKELNSSYGYNMYRYGYKSVEKTDPIVMIPHQDGPAPI